MLVADVVKATASVMGVGREVLLAQDRTRAAARPRQVGMYLSHRMTKATKVQIGKVWGGRDHTTVRHAVETVEGLLAEGDQGVITLVAEITAHLSEVVELPDGHAISAARLAVVARIDTAERDLARLKAALAALDASLISGAAQ